MIGIWLYIGGGGGGGVNVFSNFSTYDYQAKIRYFSLINVKAMLFTFFQKFWKIFKLNNTGARQLAKKLLQKI